MVFKNYPSKRAYRLNKNKTSQEVDVIRPGDSDSIATPPEQSGCQEFTTMITVTHVGHRDYFTFNGEVFTSVKALRKYLRDQRG